MRIPRCWYPALALAAAVGACSPGAPAPSPGPVSPPAAPTAPAAPAAQAATVVSADLYHPTPRDTVEAPVYKGWQQLMLHCARCHGDDALGTTFGPSLVLALKPDGNTPTRDEFLNIVRDGRQDKGMPSAAKMGLDSVHFDGLYQYLKGRSDGRLHGGRPARRD